MHSQKMALKLQILMRMCVGDNADFYPEDADRKALIDTDGDEVDDRDDAFPEDATETVDT